ncbi:MAG: plastocyanin/azurin family copper-binding protein [Gemmatimonadaceae bacterium]
MRNLRIAGAGLALAGLALGVAGCVSDRAAGPGIDLEGCNVQLPAEAFGSTIVVIRDFNFSPAQVSVAPGGKVTWVSCEPPGSESHTSTADAGAWSSPLLAPGATFTRQFGAAGTFAYHCEPHPGMRGSVVVQ